MSNKYDDITQITNIQERRDLLIPYYSELIGQPYNQYITKHNQNILQACVATLFDASMCGYEYQDVWEAQTGTEKDNSILRVFRIQRTFQGITLTDEQFDAVANFAQAIRTIKANDIKAISDAIGNYITNEYAILSSARSLTMIMYVDQPVIQALIYYNLLPEVVSAETTIIAIPPEYKGYKLWYWATVPEGGYEYWMPELGEPFVFTGEDGEEYNPMFLLPEWIYRVV